MLPPKVWNLKKNQSFQMLKTYKICNYKYLAKFGRVLLFISFRRRWVIIKYAFAVHAKKKKKMRQPHSVLYASPPSVFL